jgi:fused signal recognition particle receptor
LPFFRRKPKPESAPVAEAEREAEEAPLATLEAPEEPEALTEAQRIAEEKTEQALARTRRSWFGRITGILDRPKIDDDLWLELEEVLLGADVGLKTTEKILEDVRGRVEKERVREAQDVRQLLKDEMVAILTAVPLKGALWRDETPNAPKPGVVLVVGVNGTGKTTTIAKLAHLYKTDGREVVLAAGDTFRAAAIDQLKHWGERVGATVIAHKEGADPGAVAFDAVGAAQNRHADVAIIDTAGRLHTKFNLMEELRKVRRVIERRDPTAPHEVLLVLDATTGQNALIQAKAFADAVDVTAIALTKLDGTSKGGIVFAISDELGLPVRFVGTGEGEDDLQPFDADAFVDALFE